LLLEIKLTATAFKYLKSLEKPTKQRIQEKLTAIAAAPTDPRLSKPLTGVTKRTARVCEYRIIFEIDQKMLLVADVGPRGRIYRNLT
jgi:mRNA-degrading endonuclease RelE of RelBE toxin-antitoxin system